MIDERPSAIVVGIFGEVADDGASRQIKRVVALISGTRLTPRIESLILTPVSSRDGGGEIDRTPVGVHPARLDPRM